MQTRIHGYPGESGPEAAQSFKPSLETASARQKARAAWASSSSGPTTEFTAAASIVVGLCSQHWTGDAGCFGQARGRWTSSRTDRLSLWCHSAAHCYYPCSHSSCWPSNTCSCYWTTDAAVAL